MCVCVWRGGGRGLQVIKMTLPPVSNYQPAQMGFEVNQTKMPKTIDQLSLLSIEILPSCTLGFHLPM